MTQNPSLWREAVRDTIEPQLVCPKCGELQPMKGKHSLEYDSITGRANCSVCGYVWTPILETTR